MNITTKFDLGQQVVVIWHGPTEHWIPCPVCHGERMVHIVESTERFLCPRCRGSGSVSECIPSYWHIAHQGIVGRVQVETRVHDTGEWPETPENPHTTQTPSGPMHINYQIDTTGVGSGTMHYEPQVFSTETEAQAECDRRNAGNEERGMV